MGRGRLLLDLGQAEVEEQSCNVLDPEMRKSHPAESSDAEESECDPDSQTERRTNQSQFGKLLERGVLAKLLPPSCRAACGGGCHPPPTCPEHELRIESATGRDKTISFVAQKWQPQLKVFVFDLHFEKERKPNCAKLFEIAFAFTQNNDWGDGIGAEIIGHSTLRRSNRKSTSDKFNLWGLRSDDNRASPRASFLKKLKLKSIYKPLRSNDTNRSNRGC